MYSQVASYQESEEFSEREKLAIEFAERYALDHENMDETFWQRLRRHYTDAEVFDLGASVACWLGYGRLLRVLDVEDSCSIEELRTTGNVSLDEMTAGSPPARR
jgi:alkylhydroperoxidase family enzyme